MSGNRGSLQWSDCPIQVASLVFFDIETTGLRPDRGARITEIALIAEREVRFSWSSDREKPRDGVVARMLPLLFEQLQEGVVVGHNVGFDLHFIAYEADRLGVAGPDLRFVDTLGLARRLLDVGNYQLGALLEEFKISVDEDLHTAIVDARATRQLFWQLVEVGALETLRDLGVTPLNWGSF